MIPEWTLLHGVVELMVQSKIFIFPRSVSPLPYSVPQLTKHARSTVLTEILSHDSFPTLHDSSGARRFGSIRSARRTVPVGITSRDALTTAQCRNQLLPLLFTAPCLHCDI